MIASKRIGVHQDLADSIVRTLRKESLRNELVIAWVRVFLLGTVTLIETLWAVEGLGINFWARTPVYAHFALSLVILAALLRGHFHTSLAFILPVLDTAAVASRMHANFIYHPLANLREAMEMATIVGVSGVIILSGAMRLQRSTIALTTALGVANYLWFARLSQLDVKYQVVHLALLGAIAGIGLGLTQIVHRAVRSEIGRLTLVRFLPAAVIDGAYDDPLALVTSPRNVDVTILVTDIRGFTQWAENRDPIDVLGHLNLIQGGLAEVVRKHSGTVDKFLGDGMLAVFGAPEPLTDHAQRAIAAAIEIDALVAKLRQRTGAMDINVGVGVHSGEVVVGCLGSGLRMEFTVLGDTVNTASRLEALTKELGHSVLISDETCVAANSNASLVEAGALKMRGRSVATKLWTLETPLAPQHVRRAASA